MGTASSLGDKSSQEVPGGLDRETIARVVHVCVSVSRNKLVLNELKCLKSYEAFR